MSSHCLQSVLNCLSSMVRLSNMNNTEMQSLSLAISGEVNPLSVMPDEQQVFYSIDTTAGTVILH